MNQLLQLDVLPSTVRTYNSNVTRYGQFCAVAGLPFQPDPAQVQQFIICMVTANYKLSTIAVTMSALRRWAADEWGMTGVLDEPRVQRALKVAARWAVQEKRQKLPLSAVNLKAVIAMLRNDQPGGQYIAARDEAMFTVAWAGMLRASETVGLEWDDVHFTRAGELMLYLPKTKTDPGAGSWVLLAAGTAGGPQPAAAMWDLRELVGGEAAAGPVFKPSFNSAAALQKVTVATRLKKALARIGVRRPDLYAAHSLRRMHQRWGYPHA
jgi:integrase